MVNASKPVILVVVSLLVVMLIYSSSYSVLAVKNPSPGDVCDVFIGTCECTNDVETLSATCCVLQQTDSKGGFVHICETCSINTDTGDYYNCSVYRKSPTTGQANVPKGGGVIEQPPPTPKKHGGTVLPKGGGTIEQPDQGTTQTDDNNKPSVKRSQDGGSLELPQTGELTTKKGNNDNSPTPPPCPDKGPIPPNCTLKPKF